MADKIKCPECGSKKTWAKGSVPTRSGPKKRYICFDCGRTFYKAKGSPKAGRKK